MYLSTVALCTWHCDKLVLRTCTFPTYSEFFVSVCCSPSAALLLRGSWQPRLTSTVLKRCSSSSSGGIGSLTPLVWPVEPGGANAAFPSFPAGASTLPAAFPISGYPIDPRNTHTNKNCSKEAAEKVNKCSVSSCLQLMFCEARDLSLFPWPRSVDPCWSSSHDSSIFSNKEKAGGWNPPVPLSEILVHYETLERGKGISWEWQTEWQLSEWKRKKGGGDRVQSLSLCTHNTRLQEDRKKKRKINKKRFHFWVPLCSGEWIKKKKKNSGGNYSRSCRAVGWWVWAGVRKPSICCWMLGVSGTLIFMSRGGRGKEEQAEIQQAAAESTPNRDRETEREAAGGSGISSHTGEHRATSALWVLTPPCSGRHISDTKQKKVHVRTPTQECKG